MFWKPFENLDRVNLSRVTPHARFPFSLPLPSACHAGYCTLSLLLANTLFVNRKPRNLEHQCRYHQSNHLSLRSGNHWVNLKCLKHLHCHLLVMIFYNSALHFLGHLNNRVLQLSHRCRHSHLARPSQLLRGLDRAQHQMVLHPKQVLGVLLGQHQVSYTIPIGDAVGLWF